MRYFNFSEQEKILRENVIRMYHETDLWGAKEA